MPLATAGLFLATAVARSDESTGGNGYQSVSDAGIDDATYGGVVGLPSGSLSAAEIAEAQRELAAPGVPLIVGNDNRVKVTDTTKAPYRSVVQLVRFVNDQVYSLCTGTFVASDVILTAAHCIQDSPTEPLAEGFLVVPAQDGLRFPFGSEIAVSWEYPRGWADSGYDDPAYDIAIIRLAHDTLGHTVGTLGVITAMTDADLSASDLDAYTVGYPADEEPGTMWVNGITSLTHVYPDLLVYDLDVEHGQSGSPVFRGSDLRIFSVVSEGCTHLLVVCDTDGGEDLYNNFSVRITVTVARALASYCQQLGCSLYYEVPVVPSPTPSPTPTRTATPPARPSVMPYRDFEGGLTRN